MSAVLCAERPSYAVLRLTTAPASSCGCLAASCLRTNRAEKVRPICERELHFLEGALMKNPKAYTTWEHRLWTVRKVSADISTLPSRLATHRLARCLQHGNVAAEELLLCAKFLKFDERNFHCWGYRRHMAQLAQATAGEELAFTADKVESNFSNYSAWHSRSKLLPQVCFPLQPHL